MAQAPWPFVRKLIHLDVADSTNDVAKQIAQDGEPASPLAVWADRQMKGRGQRDRLWWSDGGSLTFSLLLDPRQHGLTSRHEPLLALTAAVAVADLLLASCGVRAAIRWPNDIEVGGRKLGGILPERVEAPAGVRLVIGVGINVSSRLDDAPAEVRAMATSVSESMAPAGPTPDHETLLRRLLVRIEDSVERLVRDQTEFASEWQSRNALFNQHVRVDLGPRIAAGVCRAIDADGALLVEADGQTVHVYGGRVLRG